MHISAIPLNALRAFEASARHLSLSRAADELHVTPSAVSHQIRTLEDLLQVKLFERKVREIELTEAGGRLFPGLQAGFARIQDAVDSLQPRTGGRVLVVSTPPGFTAKWLAPRLYRFATAHPEIDARVSSSIANADFRTDGIDIAIRNLPQGRDPGPGLTATKMLDITLVPVCSPALVEKYGPLESERDIAKLPLIHDETFVTRTWTPGWAEWLRAAGVGHPDRDRGLRFNSADHAVFAAIEGAGILLAHTVMAHDELVTGRLVQPFGETLPTGRAYYLVHPAETAALPKLVAFRDWIADEVAAMNLP
jgi:LysR family glycine cleavage system transcriptional activator